MKHTLKISSFLMILLSLVVSCKEEDIVFPKQIAQENPAESNRRPVKPDYLGFVTDFNETVEINFEKTDTERVSKLHLVYQSDSKKDSITVTDFSKVLKLNNFQIGKATDLTVIAENKEGIFSNPFIYKITAKPYPSRSVFESISMLGGEGEITILWENQTKVPVNIKVDISGKQYESGMNKLGSSEMSIALKRGVYNLKLSVLDSLNKVSSVKDTSIRVVEEVAIDRKDWTATASSSYPGEGPGTPEGVLDGNLNTKWHSSYWPEDLPYPHWLMFDMKTEYLVSKIQLAPRNDNNSSGFRTFSLEGSLDGKTWFMLHANGTHDPAVKGLQSTILNNPAKARYLRLNMLTGGSNSTHLSEFVAFSIY